MEKTEKSISKKTLLNYYNPDVNDPDNDITSIAFSPGGQKIFTGSAYYKAILWTLDGKPIKEFGLHDKTVNAVAFSPDRKTILTGSADKTARLWKLNYEPLDDFLKSGKIQELTPEQKKHYGIK